MPRVSFCISTYQRPEILRTQLNMLAKQSFQDFEVVISDNDTDNSAAEIVSSINDTRFRYFSNGENIGMVRSFNKSIERAVSEFIVMITDDDPLDNDFLSDMLLLKQQYPGRSLYGGFIRTHTAEGSVEEINKHDFVCELLDSKKSSLIFWSACMLSRNDVISIGCIPDYGSPHLADHALLALAGSVNGAVIKSKVYSSHFQHENNYSKSNLGTYYLGCKGFYKVCTDHFKEHKAYKKISTVIIGHLRQWFFGMSFALRKIYYKKKEWNKIQEIDTFSKQILKLPFMRTAVYKYKLKMVIFQVKAVCRII